MNPLKVDLDKGVNNTIRREILALFVGIGRALLIAGTMRHLRTIRFMVNSTPFGGSCWTKDAGSRFTLVASTNGYKGVSQT